MRSVECGAQNERRISNRHERRAPVRFPLCTRGSALRTLHSALSRLCREETGQGILFAAAALLVLVGFVAFVFNIGRLLDRRTKMQIAADAAAYSGAMVEANAVSAIAYINSAMSQVYYNALKYAVDMNEAAVAAELERRLNYPVLSPGGPAYTTYQTVYSTAKPGLQQAKLWMLQLSQLENAIAIVAPRLVQEEMFAVAGRAGAERMSVYPSFRMFPSPDDLIQFLISRLDTGWRIVNLKNQQSLSVTLDDKTNTWDLQWTGGASSREVKIKQVTPTSWQIEFDQPPGSKIQEVSIENVPGLGWVISSTGTNPNGGPPAPMQQITFTPVDMGPTGGSITWVRVTQGGYSQILGRGPDGNIYTWNGSPVLATSNSTTIGGVNVQCNVTNLITFAGGGSAQIGNPTVVNLGGARVVLSNPPTISTGFGPVWISITGFNPNQFNISAGGFSLTAGNSNGRWNDHYNPTEEIWWRNRLVVMGLGLNGSPNQWEYDYERLGALLVNERNGGITSHAFATSGVGYTADSSSWPAWTAWFNPYPVAMSNNPSSNFSMPYEPNFTQSSVAFGPADGNGISHALSAPPADTYYQTARCTYCNGTGKFPASGAPGSCPVCHGLDNCFPNVNYTNVRVFIGDLANPLSVVCQSNPNGKFPDDFYLTAPMFNKVVTAAAYPDPSNSGVPIGPASLPLVATEDFFKWGLNIGVWAHAYNGGIVPTDTPMLFPNSIEPAWGTVAIASARVGLRDPAGGDASPYVQNGHRYAFSSAELNSGARGNWCQSLQNLYYADVQASLYASKNQVDNYDLDENILQGAPLVAIDQSGLSYLWTAILTPRMSYNNNDWMNRFNGQSDARVGQALSNMQNRQGATFDFGSSQMNQVVQH